MAILVDSYGDVEESVFVLLVIPLLTFIAASFISFLHLRRGTNFCNNQFFHRIDDLNLDKRPGPLILAGALFWTIHTGAIFFVVISEITKTGDDKIVKSNFDATGICCMIYSILTALTFWTIFIVIQCCLSQQQL